MELIKVFETLKIFRVEAFALPRKFQTCLWQMVIRGFEMILEIEFGLMWQRCEVIQQIQWIVICRVFLIRVHILQKTFHNQFMVAELWFALVLHWNWNCLHGYRWSLGFQLPIGDFLALHASILKPNLHLSLGQEQTLGDSYASSPGQIFILTELTLQFQELVTRVRGSSTLALGIGASIGSRLNGFIRVISWLRVIREYCYQNKSFSGSSRSTYHVHIAVFHHIGVVNVVVHIEFLARDASATVLRHFCFLTNCKFLQSLQFYTLQVYGIRYAHIGLPVPGDSFSSRLGAAGRQLRVASSAATCALALIRVLAVASTTVSWREA